MFSKINRIFLILSITLIPTIVSARIGETKKECEKRYGAPIQINLQGLHAYKKHNYVIMITFMDNVAITVTYLKKNASGKTIPLSQAEIKSLLAKNGNGKKWSKSILDPAAYEIHRPLVIAKPTNGGLIFFSSKSIFGSEKERKKEKEALDDL